MTTIYFKNVTGFADLKKQYRKLAFENHPDKGGDVKKMQVVNNEFEKLFEYWKDRPGTDAASSYTNDYQGASYNEYAYNVCREYGYTGENYDRKLYKNDLTKLFQAWLKNTFSSCKWSVYRRDYNSINIALIESDFPAFIAGKEKLMSDVNKYHLDSKTELTERCKEVFSIVMNFVKSYNYDKSDSMTDYFDVNFYDSYSIGRYEKPYKNIPVQLKSDKPVKREKIGKAHQAVKKALGSNYFADCYKTQYSKDGLNDKTYLVEKNVLCKKAFYDNEEYDDPLYLYCSGLTPAKKRIEQLKAVGIITQLTTRGIVQFVKYTDELQKQLDIEDKQASKEKEVKHLVNK
ncbi:MAG: molecular chaperone DnaJ [Dysgonamonadaceae bacterium]|jgi:hypothetical protein|nr:molecular chaperone DnaJ [Dysgonamonadaceae bacterium]